MILYTVNNRENGDFILDSAEVLMCSDPRRKRRMVWLIGLGAALRFYRRRDVTLTEKESWGWSGLGFLGRDQGFFLLAYFMRMGVIGGSLGVLGGQSRS